MKIFNKISSYLLAFALGVLFSMMVFTPILVEKRSKEVGLLDWDIENGWIYYDSTTIRKSQLYYLKTGKEKYIK